MSYDDDTVLMVNGLLWTGTIESAKKAFTFVKNVLWPWTTSGEYVCAK